MSLRSLLPLLLLILACPDSQTSGKDGSHLGDSSSLDRHPLDAQSTDLTSLDTTTPDATTPDMTPPDTRTADTAIPDATALDTSATDTQPPDTTSTAVDAVAADHTTPPVCQTVTATGPGYFERSLDHGGLTRVYTFLVPATGYDAGRALPAVVALHGGYGTANGMSDFSGLRTTAERDGYAVIFPEGYKKAWNAGECCGEPQRNNVDDVAFIEAVLDAVATEVCLDPARIYVTGMSNGSMMSHRLACESERFAAIAAVAGQQHAPFLASCNPSRRVPILHVHGDDDRCAVYGGGMTAGGCTTGPDPPATSATWEELTTLRWLIWAARLQVCTEQDPPVSDPDNPPPGVWCLGRMPAVVEMQNMHDSVAATIEHWRVHNSCAATPASRRIGAVEVQSYACKPPGDLVFYKIEGGGHAWPGVRPSSCCETNRSPGTDIDIRDVIWDFFRDKTLQ